MGDETKIGSRREKSRKVRSHWSASVAGVALIAGWLGGVSFQGAINQLDAQIILNQQGTLSQNDGITQGSRPPAGAKKIGGSCNIKGNISYNKGERIYHIPGQLDYNSTKISSRRGERWFCSEQEARSNGWRKAYR